MTTVIDTGGEGTSRGFGTQGLTGASWLLVRRRALRDAWLLVGATVIVALAAVIAYAGPQLVLATLDDGARDTAAAAGAGANIDVAVPVGSPFGGGIGTTRGLESASLEPLAQAIPERLPAETAGIVAGVQSWVLSPEISAPWSAPGNEVEEATAGGRPIDETRRPGDVLTFGFAADAEVALVEGTSPADATGRSREVDGPRDGVAVVASLGDNGQSVFTEPEIIEIALTRPVADVLDVGLDEVVVLQDAVGGDIALRVTGIVEPADPDAPIWQRFPDAFAPTVVDIPTQPIYRRGTVMVSDATLDELTTRLGAPVAGSIELAIDPSALTLASASTIAAQLGELTFSDDVLGEDARVAADVTSSLGPALEAYPARARAALAQMSVIVSGVVAVAAVVIMLMTRLLLSRRERDIALERARGASVASVALRAGLESLAVTVVGVALGFGASLAVAPGAPLVNAQVALVALVAAAAPPLLAATSARAMWAGKREPANRADRARVRRARGARRLTLEALAIVLGALAVVSLRSRGVLQTQSSGVDPFLAAAPVLVSLAMVVIVVRLYPLPMRLIQSLARRTRGVAGVITLAKARERIPVLPLTALVLAVAVAVAGGLLVGTVRAGQEQAAWERVGGQVRIDAQLDAAAADDWRARGLTVSEAYAREFTNVQLGSEYAEAYLLAQDVDYPDILDQPGLVDSQELRELHALADQRGPDEPVPVLASAELAAVVAPGETSQLYIGREWVDVEVTGIATATPDGWATGPFVVAPLGSLTRLEYETPWSTNVAFVSGPGAEDAVAGDPSLDQATVTTRAGWLDAVRGSALIGGVETLLAVGVAAVGVLAAVALLVTVAQGVRERGRALAMLRTQGMGARYGWWLALAELGPLTAAAVLGGAAAGLAILGLLGGALGLEVLAGGLAPPPLVASPGFIAAVAGGALVLLLIAVTAEVLAHRRERLSDVLRYGESR
ncbi:FtsX-like permease family protein [Demequina sp. NBRC 110056]|uniref:FtsX-like permease family protein n=1 Tax=Demequina sp. NBRC 110056 TaxID=1570345 RepID=UPI0009FDC03E|nr:FtsX-like permease family protein [Demequina sp. NBRC 110056]